jgi:hypothetical protein
MFYGLGEYLLLAGVLSAIVSLFLRNYAVSSILSAGLASMLNLLHESWLAHFDVNIGWGPPMLMLGFVAALPVALIAGLPSVAVRRLRKAMKADS